MPIPTYTAISESREHPQHIYCIKRCELTTQNGEKLIVAMWDDKEEKRGFEVEKEIGEDRLKIRRGNAEKVEIMIRTEKARYWVRIES